jgi:hypothetical protein
MLPGAPGDRPGSNRIPPKSERTRDADRHPSGEHQHHHVHRPRHRRVPYCRTRDRTRQTSDTGRIQAWACDHCITDWAFSVPNSHTTAALADDAVAQEIRRLRWALTQVITLADEMPKLTDVELRTRLLMLLTELGAR